MGGESLLRWPTLQRLQNAVPKTQRTFFYEHTCRSEELIEKRIAQIRPAVAAIQDAALLQAGILCLHNSIRLLEQMRNAIAAVDRQIAETYRQHPDHALLACFRGAGPALVPRLIAAVGSPRERFGPEHCPLCRQRAGKAGQRPTGMDPLAVGLP